MYIEAILILKEVKNMFQNIGVTEIIIILVVIMVLFGAKKLPEFARGLGESGRELKKASRELKDALVDEEEGKTEKKS
jgi:sec-independent protein translocase protein TatA